MKPNSQPPVVGRCVPAQGGGDKTAQEILERVAVNPHIVRRVRRETLAYIATQRGIAGAARDHFIDRHPQRLERMDREKETP